MKPCRYFGENELTKEYDIGYCKVRSFGRCQLLRPLTHCQAYEKCGIYVLFERKERIKSQERQVLL
jgi:hypothetical protein